MFVRVTLSIFVLLCAVALGCADSPSASTSQETDSASNAEAADSDVSSGSETQQSETDDFRGRMMRAQYELQAGRVDEARTSLAPLMERYDDARYGELLELVGKIDQAAETANPSAETTVGSTTPIVASQSATNSTQSMPEPAGPAESIAEAGAADAPESAGVGGDDVASGATPQSDVNSEPVAAARSLSSVSASETPAIEEGFVPQTVWVTDAPEVRDETAPADKRDIDHLEAEKLKQRIQQTPRARDALKYFNYSLARVNVPERDQADFDKEEALLSEKAAEDLWRNGTRWQTEAEFREAEKLARTHYQNAIKQMQRDLLEPALDSLTLASRANFHDIRADYLAGLIAVSVGLVDLDAAKDHFGEVLSRRPDHIGAMHNLGVLAVKQGNLATAYRLWSQVAELDPRCPQLKHNIERFVLVAGNGLVTANDRDLKRIQRLLIQLDAEGNQSIIRGVATAQALGWMFIPLAATSYVDIDKLEKSGAYHSVTEMGMGTGFVIAPEIVLTNRHVIWDEQNECAFPLVQLALPSEEEVSYHGAVIAFSNDRDLALVRFKGLDLPALRLAAESPRRSEEIMIFGYPKPIEGGLVDLGRRLKATRGVVTSRPEATRNVGSMLVLDALASPGNSGGPAVLSNGSVGGVVTAITSALQRVTTSVADYTFAIDSKDAIAFSRSVIPSLQLGDGPRGDWADVDTLASKSTVRLVTCRVETSMEFTMPDAGRGYVLEDRSCPRCNGRGVADCGNCVRGTIREKRMVQTGTDFKGRAINSPRFFSKDCSSCSNGFVPCSNCRGSKYDPTL